MQFREFFSLSSKKIILIVGVITLAVVTGFFFLLRPVPHTPNPADAGVSFKQSEPTKPELAGKIDISPDYATNTRTFRGNLSEYNEKTGILTVQTELELTTEKKITSLPFKITTQTKLWCLPETMTLEDGKKVAVKDTYIQLSPDTPNAPLGFPGSKELDLNSFISKFQKDTYLIVILPKVYQPGDENITTQAVRVGCPN